MSDILKWNDKQLDFSNSPLVMGILNVTPDSFSDGGEFFDIDRAVERGVEMVSQGADIIDIGPESSRPGSERVSAEEQISRAVPVIEKLSKKVELPISIDAYLAEVASACLDAGASIVNDISAGRDPEMFKMCAERGVPIILMHMKGMPEDMQKNAAYGDVLAEINDYLVNQAKLAQESGIPKEKIILDPGIGFGKTLDHNLILLNHLAEFKKIGYRILLGASRKSFIGTITGRKTASERLAGTISTSVIAVQSGVDIIRVHDVAENRDAVMVTRQIIQSR